MLPVLSRIFSEYNTVLKNIDLTTLFE